MDYKKIIGSRSVRLRLLNLLSVIPDEPMLKLQYRIKTGRRLDLENPKRFSEKLQWYKLHYKDPLMIRCVDKCDVRDYVKQKGMGSFLVPCYGVYDSADDIDWDALPDQFVIKDTLGGGGTSVVIVKDKSSADIDDLMKRCKGWTAIDAHRRSGGREWPYYSGKSHRIIIEKYLAPEGSMTDIRDYKFFCFNGEPRYCQVISDRSVDEKIDFFDMEWNRLIGLIGLIGLNPDAHNSDAAIPRPESFDDMKDIATKTSAGFPFVRIDLYEVDGKAYFGEMTFFPASGYGEFLPPEWNERISGQFVLPDELLVGGGYKLTLCLIDNWDLPAQQEWRYAA